MITLAEERIRVSRGNGENHTRTQTVLRGQEVSKTQSTAEPVRKTRMFLVEQKGTETFFCRLKEYYHKDSNSIEANGLLNTTTKSHR